MVRMPISRVPRVTGSPETLYLVMISSAWRMEISGEMVTGSTIIPLSERFTRSTSSRWRATLILRWIKPMPPCRAMAMARRDSVTVSMAAEQMGTLMEICRVMQLRVSTSVGITAE